MPQWNHFWLSSMQKSVCRGLHFHLLSLVCKYNFQPCLPSTQKGKSLDFTCPSDLWLQPWGKSKWPIFFLELFGSLALEMSRPVSFSCHAFFMPISQQQTIWIVLSSPLGMFFLDITSDFHNAILLADGLFCFLLCFWNSLLVIKHFFQNDSLANPIFLEVCKAVFLQLDVCKALLVLYPSTIVRCRSKEDKCKFRILSLLHCNLAARQWAWSFLCRWVCYIITQFILHLDEVISGQLWLPPALLNKQFQAFSSFREFVLSKNYQVSLSLLKDQPNHAKDFYNSSSDVLSERPSPWLLLAIISLFLLDFSFLSN